LAQSDLHITGSVYPFKVKRPDGEEIQLDTFKGKVVLIVNTASRCGRAPQLRSLESLYQKYKGQGFIVVGFPSNDFSQEPLEGTALQEYCEINYGVSFLIMDKIHVRGSNAHPLFQFFSDKKKNGRIATTPRWNYYKFLVGRDGKVIDSFWTYRGPLNKKIIRAIETALSVETISK
jgi:glutathione peroxidase